MVMDYRIQQQMHDVIAFGMGLILTGIMFGLVKQVLVDSMEPKPLLPQTEPRSSRHYIAPQSKPLKTAYGDAQKYAFAEQYLIERFKNDKRKITVPRWAAAAWAEFHLSSRKMGEWTHIPYWREKESAQQLLDTLWARWESRVERVPQVLIEGGEPMPLQYRHLIWWVKDPLPEYSLMTLPAVVPERRYSVEEVAKKLEEGVKTIHEDRNFRLFLQTMSKFHDYSFGNQILIMLQRPDATKVAGFVTWKELGRYVKRGESGIAIQAPVFPAKEALWERRDGAQWTVRRINREWGVYMTRTAEGYRPVTLLDSFPSKWEAERQVRAWGGRRIEVEAPLEDPSWFKVVYVFDISQTEGKPLPEFEVPVLTIEVDEELFAKTMALTRAQGLEVSFESRPHQDPGIKGQYSPPNRVWIRPEEPRAQQLKSLLHEVAHHYSEGVFRIPRADAETIAESAAYVVGAHYGFDTGTRSFPYVALWARDEKVLRQNLDAIRRVSTTMLDKLAEIESTLAMVPQTIPLEDLRRIADEYGMWAAKLAEAVCPYGDVDCVEREARRLIEARRARLR